MSMVYVGAGGGGGGGARCDITTLVLRWCLCVCVCVCVHTTEAQLESMMVLVNREKLIEIYNVFNDDFNKNIEYQYVAGDQVDVSCIFIKQNSSCFVQTHFDYINGAYSGQQSYGYETMRSRAGVGVRSTLRAAHHRTNVTCEFMCPTHSVYKAILNITFMLQNEIDDTFKLSVNELTWKYVRPGNKKLKLIYNYISDEHPSIVFETNKDFELDRRYIDPTPTHSSVSGTRRISIMYDDDLNSNHQLQFYAFNTTTNGLQANVTIAFKELPAHLRYFDNSLRLETNDTSDVTTMYEYSGDRVVRYQFIEDERATVTCSLWDYLQRSGYYLNFNGTESTDILDGIQKTIQANPGDSSTTLDCSLLYNNSDSTEVQVLVCYHLVLLFFQRHNMTTDVSGSVQAPITLISSLVVLAVMCTLTLVLCWWKKRGGGGAHAPESQPHTTSPHEHTTAECLPKQRLPAPPPPEPTCPLAKQHSPNTYDYTYNRRADADHVPSQRTPEQAKPLLPPRARMVEVSSPQTKVVTSTVADNLYEDIQ